MSRCKRLKIIHKEGQQSFLYLREGSFNDKVYQNYINRGEGNHFVSPVLTFYEVQMGPESYLDESRYVTHSPISIIKIHIITETIVRIEEY